MYSDDCELDLWLIFFHDVDFLWRDVVDGQTTPRQGQSRESSRGREPYGVDIKKSSKPAPPAAKELTEEEIEKKTKTILDEYLHVHDMKVMGIEKCTR